MSRGTATGVARRQKRVSQAGFPDRADTVVITGQRNQGLICWSKGNNKTGFLKSSVQKGCVTVGALKTMVLNILIAPFIFLDVLVISQD